MPVRCRHSPLVIHGVISAMLPMSTQMPPNVSSMSRLVAGMPAPGSPEKKRMRTPRLRGSRPSRRADGGQGLPRGAGAERKGRGAEPLHPRERSPRAHVQAEEGADHHAIVGSDPGAPEDTGVRFSDARPVIPADAEDRGPARGAARAVNPHDVGRLDAEVVAEWR